MNTAVAALVVAVVVPLTGGLLWASHKYPTKYAKLVWNFWSGILVGCGFTVVLFGTSLVLDTIRLEEALEAGEHVALYAKTVLKGLKIIGGAIFVAATGTLYFWVIGRIGEILNENDDSEPDTKSENSDA